ncbi:uncharacterized protein CTHT_0031710 [Thermochaetoides thermophila DSM 1495]|uniref:FAM50A/XAP5 C-terminal domain-containing protein n=1 Tax=Chaetomium thermophilum (strain DSM 1495 / CBS 144.50 / IMI 039719) TaxID=759272 RepID=G0S4U5_CHATD|nr:hypothetical protein CTHT_0031710 [Thermochaetoides thermophila DSM 1495]EGS21316.1 hypothetical protein CTHT_0031710 [Thermochaetoides thermophila DSM 1495]
MASGIKRKQDDDASDSWSGKGPGSDLQTSPDCKSVSNMAEPCRPVPRRWEPNPHLDAYFRNLYTSEPDFKKLAVQDPDFATYVQNGRLNFTDPDAMMQLTKTLLKVDFGLRIDLPRDRLCPPDRIRVLERKPEDKLVPIGEIGIESVDFVMMNPPFYSSEDDMLESAKRKSRPPMSACTGARVEMVCDGGEVAHVCRLLSESLILRERVSWYTSMLGKLSSLEILVEKLRTHGIDNYAVTEFIQGTKTRRWALGWSFGPMRPAENAARGMKSSAGRKLLPPPVTAKLLVSSTDRTTHELLSTNTVGLVALSDFRKRRAEVLEQQEREAREALSARSGIATPDRSLTATPSNASDSINGDRERPPKKKKRTRALISFGDDEDGGDGSDTVATKTTVKKPKFEDRTQLDGTANESSGNTVDAAVGEHKENDKNEKSTSKITANTSVGIVPRPLTKAALRREAAEREALRKEFLQIQAAVKATEIAIPFVFYDGTNIPGGIVRVKKGDHVWLFLDKSRKVGAKLGVGADKMANARRAWARVSVDDLMLVRGSLIIPHHYDFYFFIINKTVGPGNQRLFNYSTEAPASVSGLDNTSAGGINSEEVDISQLEGASDDPTFTKVVDRRWYQRNKHIYPASVWQEFDPEKDYSKEIRRDPGGNAFFFAK